MATAATEDMEQWQNKVDSLSTELADLREQLLLILSRLNPTPDPQNPNPEKASGEVAPLDVAAQGAPPPEPPERPKRRLRWI
jgi:hypothetical protein